MEYKIKSKTLITCFENLKPGDIFRVKLENGKYSCIEPDDVLIKLEHVNKERIETDTQNYLPINAASLKNGRTYSMAEWSPVVKLKPSCFLAFVEE